VTASKRRYHWALYAATAFFSVVLTLALIEIGFALLYPVPFSIEHNLYYEADPHVGYKLRPNSVGNFQHGILAETNVHGHRDDPPVEDGEAHCRVLVLGDSLSVGNNVEQHEAYPQLLERMLDERFPFRVEVINTAVGGWSPFQYAQYYQHYGRDFDHQIVLVGFFVGNDSYSQTTSVLQDRTAIAGRRVSRRAAVSNFARARVFLHEHSHLARFIGSRRTPLGLNRTRDHCQDFSKGFLAVQRRRFSNHLRLDKQPSSTDKSVSQIQRIERLAKEESIPLLVALLPDENQINRGLQDLLVGPNGRDDYDFQMPQKLLVEMFADRHIDTIDLLPWFREDRRCLYMNDTHWNPDGHRLAASILYERLAPSVAIACESLE
jgi:hypothetical protein